MGTILEKFARLGVDSAPGQEIRQNVQAVRLIGESLPGTPVDFSHGDVNAFPPTPGAIELFARGFEVGAAQAYTEYRGKKALRETLAMRLAAFTGAPIDPDREIILTPGTQGALFLAMGASIARGDKVAIVEPDYFANRKLVEFFDGELMPVPMGYMAAADGSGIDLVRLEDVFRQGAKLFLFSNPNNPTGAVYSRREVAAIATLAARYGASVIADELYSRQIFDGRDYTHLRALGLMNPDNLVTILGPSKTESLSGFRLGVAFGSAQMIERMEKLQAIVSLRCAGYCQAVFECWLDESEGWMAERVAQHQAIRDELCALIDQAEGFSARRTEGGSYLFVEMPVLNVGIVDFTKALRQLAAVSVTPGTEFGPAFTRHFRVNFSQDREAAVAAMRRTIEIANRYRA